MSRKEKINRQLDFLTDSYRNTHTYIMAILTGLAGLSYAVISGEKPIFTLALGIVGLIAFYYFIRRAAKINKQRNELLDELERID